MLKVEKRDGTIVDFNVSKIINAIEKAFVSCKMTYDPQIFDLLVLRVSADVQPKIHHEIVSVEDIQDSVERVLSQAGYTEVAKSYILYRKQRENVRRIETTTLDYKNIVDSYLDNSDRDLTIDQPSIFSVGGLILSNSGAITKNYWLSEVYDTQIEEAHNSGLIHIHDLDMLTGDSASWSLLTLITNGIQPGPDQIQSRPAKHLMTLCNQMVNALGILQNEWAGAQTFSSFDTYLAPYVKQDHLTHSEIKKALETFIYGVNIPSRWGTQTPFSNVLFDMEVPEDLKNVKAWVGNREMDFTYGDCKEEMKMIQDAFFEILYEGDAMGNGFPFPIPTVMIDENFDFDGHENLFKCTGKYGSPYFVNRTQSDFKHSSLKMVDSSKWNKKPGFYSYPENSGNIGTVTINLVRLALISKQEDEFFEHLEQILDLSCRSLRIKSQVLTKLLKSGLYPYTSQYIENFDHHFSTIGIVGMNEAGLNAAWLKKDMTHIETQNFAGKVLTFIRDRLILKQKETNSLYNLEATPAESVSYRFACKDKELYPDLIMNDTLAYTNSTQMPFNNEKDLFETLKIQENIQRIYNGGVSFPINISQGIMNEQAVRTLVKTIIQSFDIYDFMLSPIYSVCSEHGYLKGLQTHCPKCQKTCTIWARVAGYYHSVNLRDERVYKDFLKQNHFDIE